MHVFDHFCARRVLRGTERARFGLKTCTVSTGRRLLLSKEADEAGTAEIIGNNLGGGEAGAEAIVGVDSLRGMIQEAVAGQTSAIVTALSGFGGGGDITIPVYLGGTLLDETIVTAQQRMALRSGGR